MRSSIPADNVPSNDREAIAPFIDQAGPAAKKIVPSTTQSRPVARLGSMTLLHTAPALTVTSLAFALSCPLLPGCSGSSSDPPGPASTASSPVDGGATSPTVSPHCAAYCGWKERCGARHASCTEGCEEETGPLRAHTRPEYFTAMEQCFGSLECREKDDACTADFSRVDPAFPNIPEIQRCLAKREECNGGFSNDRCLSLVVLTDDARREADACSTRACADVDACLRAAGAW